MVTLVAIKATRKGHERNFSGDDSEKASDLARKLECLKERTVKIFHSRSSSPRSVAQIIGSVFGITPIYMSILDSPLDFQDLETLIAVHKDAADVILLVGASDVISFIDSYAYRIGANTGTYPISKMGAYILDINEKSLSRIKGKKR